MREYEVTVGGIPHTVQLSEEDADRLGATAQPVGDKQAKPRNKGRQAANKTVNQED